MIGKQAKFLGKLCDVPTKQHSLSRVKIAD